MIGKFTGNYTCACGFSIGFERIVMLLLERDFKVPSSSKKKAYLIDKKATPELMKKVISQANEERKNGYKVSINVMKKNKKFQKEQMTAEGYTEFVEFFNKLHNLTENNYTPKTHFVEYGFQKMGKNFLYPVSDKYAASEVCEKI